MTRLSVAMTIGFGIHVLRGLWYCKWSSWRKGYLHVIAGVQTSCRLMCPVRTNALTNFIDCTLGLVMSSIHDAQMKIRPEVTCVKGNTVASP